MGSPWSDDEIIQLLQCIRKKKSISEIAEIHQRTEGGIKYRLREIAADYHFNDNRPLDEIHKYTGLSFEQIEDAIKRREIRTIIQEKRKNEGSKTVNKQVINDKKIVNKYDFIGDDSGREPTMREMMTVLLDVQKKLTTILEWRE